MPRTVMLSVVLTLLGGCGGQYILTVPDQIAPAGGEAPVVIRLQRNDFFVMSIAVKDASLWFRIGEGPLRAAHTDKLGYAGAPVPVPGRAGQYVLDVGYMDPSEGDEVFAEAPLYVWDPQRKVVAVDLDDLPAKGHQDAVAATAALGRIADKANIVYLTRRNVSKHAAAHDMLAAAGYPDGPVLLWQRERWHIVRSGRWYSLPKIVVETRMVSQLAELRKVFPKLEAGICTTWLAAKGFAGAEMACLLVGPAEVEGKGVTRFASWAKLAETDL